MADEKTLVDRLFDPLPAFIWASLGWVISQFWRRFRTRLAVLRWQANHQPLAVSAHDATFGKIEVQYNGAPVQNLFFSTVDLQNQSNSDLTDVDLNVFFQDGTIIYMARGVLEGSANELPFTDPFESELQLWLELDEDDPSRGQIAARLAARRDFRVPVLNRGGAVKIGMLVQAAPGTVPHVILASDSRGVRLRFQPAQDLLFGVERGLAALTGLTLGVLLVVAILQTALGTAPIALAAFAVGCVTAVLGAAVVRAFRWLLRMIG